MFFWSFSFPSNKKNNCMRFDLDCYDIGTITSSLLPAKGGAPWCHRRTGGTIAHYSVQYIRPSISSCFYFILFYFILFYLSKSSACCRNLGRRQIIAWLQSLLWLFEFYSCGRYYGVIGFDYRPVKPSRMTVEISRSPGLDSSHLIRNC